MDIYITIVVIIAILSHTPNSKLKIILKLLLKFGGRDK